MIKVVFWNIKRKNLLALAGQLALDQDADILVLAENTREVSRVLDAINTGVPRPFISDFTPDESLVILHRYPKDSVRIVSDPSHMSIRKVTPPLGPSFLLVAVHLPSRLFRDKDDLGHLASSFVAAEELIKWPTTPSLQILRNGDQLPWTSRCLPSIADIGDVKQQPLQYCW